MMDDRVATLDDRMLSALLDVGEGMLLSGAAFLKALPKKTT